MSYNIAVPSWVIPADIAENVRFLENKVAEIEILCFEPSLPCLENIPTDSHSFHLHLPTSAQENFFFHSSSRLPSDLSCDFSSHTDSSLSSHSQKGGLKYKNIWELAKNKQNIQYFATTCLRIVEHCHALNPHHGILHLPPINPQSKEQSKEKAFEQLVYFLDYWRLYADLSFLTLENVKDASYQDFCPLLEEYQEVNLCFDIAHAIAYNQKNTLDLPHLLERIQISHWSAPYALDENNTPIEHLNRDRHLRLSHLLLEEDFCLNVLQSIPKETRHTLEIFSWTEIQASLPFFFHLQRQANLIN